MMYSKMNRLYSLYNYLMKREEIALYKRFMHAWLWNKNKHINLQK